MNEQNDPRRGGTSASNSAADLLCPGRHIAQQGIPESESSDSEFGRQIHAAIASGSDDGLSEQQLSIVESCREIESKLIIHTFGSTIDEVKMFREQRLWCKVPHGDIRYEHSGQPDLVARVGTKGLIIDFKTLPSDVPESSTNQQLRDLAVLASRALLLSEVVVVIVQPLVTHNPVPCAYGPKDIDRAEQDMWSRVIKSNDPTSPRAAGEVQCKFCKAKSTCPNYAQWSATMLPAPVSIFDVPVAEWTPQQCATFCERRAFASKWLEDATTAMKKRLEANPEAIPGWELEPGNKTNAVVNPQQLFDRFLTLVEEGLKKDPANKDATEDYFRDTATQMFMECVTIAKGKLEAQVRAGTGAKGKALLGKMNKLLEGLTEERQNAPSLTRKKTP